MTIELINVNVFEMKLLRIIILIAFVVSFMSLDAICDDHHETTEHHHGIVICHASCCGTVLTNDNTVDLPNTAETSFNLQNDFIYKAPFLPTEERPPLSLLS